MSTAPRDSVAANLRALRAAQKPQAGTPLYSRLVNRPVGRVFAAVGARLGLSPNAISLLSAAFSFAAIALVATGAASVTRGIVISALLVIGYALDSADGQVARLTKTFSPLGEWLDHMIDCAKVASLHTALAWHVLAHTDLDRRWVLAPLAFAVVAMVTFFGMILTDQLRRAAGMAKPSGPPTKGDLLKAIAVLPSDYGLLCLLFVLLGLPTVFFPVYAAVGLATFVLLLAALTKWVRQLSSMTTKA